MLKLKLHIKILGGEMEDKEKVVALYNYIAEVSKSLKDTKINVTEEKWFDFFENFPKHENIIFDYKNLDESYFENEENRLLEIKKSNFLLWLWCTVA